MCNFFYRLICIIPRVLLSNANRVCIKAVYERSHVQVKVKAHLTFEFKRGLFLITPNYLRT